jgi:hypothetical protein
MNTGHDHQTSARRRRRVIMTRPSPRLRLTAAAILTGGGLVVASLATATPAAAATTTATFGYSSNYQSFTVPAGVTTVYAVLDGGSGGNGQGSYDGGGGEPGGEVMGDMAVTPGEVLTLWVGGGGQPDGGQGFGSPTHDDFEGGSGGSGYGPGTGNGGGGGGATYLEANGQVMMLAGGGGGGGGSGTYSFGTNVSGGYGSPGGFEPASDPFNPDSYANTYDAGYGQTDGGAGGGASTTDSDNGGAGGGGGNGVDFGGGGGGGGGGYAICDPDNIGCWSAGGGGGGGNDSNGGGGGAGGDSFADPSLTGVTFGQSGFSATASGQITIQYGPVSSTTVTSSAATANPGQSVTFHAFVDPADPTDGSGTVTFASDGTTIPGCANLGFFSGGGTDWEAACTTSSLPLGSNTITATYSGDNDYAGSSGSTVETITKYSTTTTLTASPSSPEVNAPATLTADVNTGDGGGSVAFTTNGTALSGCGAVPLTASGTGYKATCTTSWSQAVGYLVEATYSGDANTDGSEGSLTVNVSGPAPTTISLSLSSGIVVYGHEQEERVSATVSPVSGSSANGTPGGTVTISSGSTTVCTITLASGSGSCTLSAAVLPAPFADLTASYSGSTDFAPSTTSGGVPLVVDQAASTTALSTTKVTYGDEQAEKLSVTVSPQYSGTPAGTVTVRTVTATVCTITLDSGTGSCTLTATQFPVGSTQLAATYSGNADFTSSTSPEATLTVAKAASTTALSLSASKVTYGDEQAEHVSVTVTSKLSGTPDGTVAVKSGSTTVCTITLGSGKGSCTLTATKLPAGTQHLTASYNGGADLASSTSAAGTLTVAKATTKTALSLSTAKVIYGHEQAERLSVTASPQYSGTPGGTVAVKSGSTTVCTITLGSGKGSCTLTATKLPAGTQHLTASYNGNADFTASTSAAKTLTVSKAASKTTLSLSATKVTYGHEQAERLSVTASPQYSGTPGGKVTIKSGKTTVCTITLGSGKGSCTLSARQLRTGTYTLVAAYPGSSDFTSSTSAKKTLTVAG